MEELADIAISRDNGQLFYCHACRHRWRKSQEADFFCPVCREGFIEQVADAGSPAQRDRTMDPIFTLVNRMFRNSEERRARSQSVQGQNPSASSSGRPRSRSPRSRATETADSPEIAISPYSISIRRRPSSRFNIDDLMSQLASASGPPPVSSNSRLEEIPKIAITPELTNSQCSICFDDFKENEPDVRKLPPCSHLYHEKCIFPWLRINGTCPVCRASLLTPSEEAAAVENRAPSFESILALVRHRTRQEHPSASSSARIALTSGLSPLTRRTSLRSSAAPRADSSAIQAEADVRIRLRQRRAENFGEFRNLMRNLRSARENSQINQAAADARTAQINARAARARSRFQQLDSMRRTGRPSTIADALNLDSPRANSSTQSPNVFARLRIPPMRAHNVSVIDLTNSDAEQPSPYAFRYPSTTSSSDADSDADHVHQAISLLQSTLPEISSSSESSTSPLSRSSSSDSDSADEPMEE